MVAKQHISHSPDAEPPPPLAEAKLAAPRLRTELVHRPRILRALDAAEGAALTLVAAPAGYGKTTAVRAWCAARQAPLAWVTLDAGDNDPVRLWTYVATAVERVRYGLGDLALRRLAATGGVIESPVDEVMNGLAALDGELVLVLDDLQSVTDPECLSSIEYAIAHLPSTHRLIVITRTDPALGLAQLRARGALAELRADELAFTTAEAHELLVERGHVDLGTEEAELLRERTEGWPAALLLAMLWLRCVDEPRRVARAFGGEHRFVAEYLSQVVLATLDDDVRSFLVRASVLGRFTDELCDGVFGRSDSASVLAELERSNLFVIRLEHGGWFRVHSLFAEFAGFQLSSAEPGAVEEIHRRAAGWLESRGLAVEALEHAAAARDDELVAELVAEHHLALIRAGRARTLLRWADSLPDRRLIEHPEVAVAAATAALMVGGRTLQQRRFLRLAKRAEAEGRAGPYVRAVAGMVRAASVDPDLAKAVLNGRRAVDIAQVDADEVLVAALGGYARALYLAGELDEAWAMALRAIEHPDLEHRGPEHAFARTTLAFIAAHRGWLTTARAQAEKAKAVVGRVGGNRSWLGANAAAAMGAVLAGEGRLADAERELAYAEHFFRDEVATLQHGWLLVLLARVRCRRGRLDEAAAALRAAKEALGELSDTGRVASLAAEVELELGQAMIRADEGEVLEQPTQAELAVLRLLGTDLSAREIGGELYLSANTVRSHTRSIYRKLGVNSRADAVARASALGLTEHTQSPG